MDTVSKLKMYLLGVLSLILLMIGGGIFSGFIPIGPKDPVEDPSSNTPVVDNSFLTIDFMQDEIVDDKGNATFKEKTEFEYGSEPVSVRSLVSEYTGDLAIEGPEYIDTKRVGRTSINFILSGTNEKGEEATKTVRKVYSVVDTQLPVITLKKDSIEIKQGESYDIASNIESIVDPVDGAIEEYVEHLVVSSVNHKNCYSYMTELDVNTAGTYEVQVVAVDTNGNQDSKVFNVVVKEASSESSDGETPDGSSKDPNQPDSSSIAPAAKEVAKETPVQTAESKPQTTQQSKPTTTETKKEESKPAEQPKEPEPAPTPEPTPAPEPEPEPEPEPVAETPTSGWDGQPLTWWKGVIEGPSGRETYYNLDMTYVVKNMRNLGYDEANYPYWVNANGCKMLGNYIMVAANLNVRPYGTIVQTSLGLGIVCDTGGFASSNPYQLDLAVNW